jgi:hypothetical protein
MAYDHNNVAILNRNFTVDAPPVFTLPETLGPFEKRSTTVEWTTSEPVHSVKCELYLRGCANRRVANVSKHGGAAV